jgi:hypothetical protein
MNKNNNQQRLLAIYDLYSYAPTFNIYEFLSGAKIFADKNDVNSIDLLILRRNLSEATIIQPQAKPEYDFRLNDIILNAIPMFPIKNTYNLNCINASEKLINSYDKLFPPDFTVEINKSKKDADRYYLQPYLRDYFLNGTAVPSISPPVFAFKIIKKLKKNNKLITITIRNAKHLTLRNSDLQSWRKVAEYYKNLDFNVIFIPDIENIESIDDQEIFSMLSVANQSYRTALYDAADLNIGVNNGAIAPLMFNANARMLLAKMFTEQTNASKSAFSKLTGITSKNEGWVRVPWHQYILNSDENADEIILNANEIQNSITNIERLLTQNGSIHPLFLDPWGKLDGTIYSLIHDILLKQDNTMNLLESLILLLLKDDRLFGNVKSLIIKSISNLIQNKKNESLFFAKQALLLDGRYADPYIIISIIYSSSMSRQLAGKIISSTNTLNSIFFRNETTNWQLEISDNIKQILISN